MLRVRRLRLLHAKPSLEGPEARLMLAERPSECVQSATAPKAGEGSAIQAGYPEASGQQEANSP